jgi:hypothetical protein
MTADMAVSWTQALAWRMRRQHLTQRASADDLVGLVGRMCGLHAQVMSSVVLAALARVDGLDREAVHDALWRDRTLVKLWAMRGTLHVLPAAELGLWLSGLASYLNQAHWQRKATPELTRLIGMALHGAVLTRAQLAVAVAGLGGQTDQILSNWGGALKPASFAGRLCFGPSSGPMVSFAHPETWIGGPIAQVDEDRALAAIARRFLATYGPASPTDLSGWWGVNRRQATEMLAALGGEATQINVGGEPYWMLADDVPELVSTAPENVVRLLPSFDQWVVCATRRIGPKSRPGPGEPALDPARRSQIYRMQGWVSPVLLVNGRIEGVWKHEIRGGQLNVDVERFGRLPRWTRQAVAAEAERLAQFLGCALKSVRN